MSVTITAATTVNDIVAKYPQTAGAFNTFGIDTCCGGDLPVSVAAAKHGVDMCQLLEALGASIVRGTAVKADCGCPIGPEEVAVEDAVMEGAGVEETAMHDTMLPKGTIACQLDW